MRAAFGKISITPENTVGVPMAGYTRPHYARGTLDEVFARAVLIEDTYLDNIPKKLLLISLDLLKVPLTLSNYIKEKIQEKAEFGLSTGNILIAAIHTHSAPDLTGEFYWPGNILSTIRGIMFGANRNDRYCIWIAYRIAKMVKEMVKNLQPVKMAWAKKIIDTDLLINRRHPTRHSKQQLGVITFKHLISEKLIGIVVNFGMHPTTLSFMNDKISPDYPGRVRVKVDELTNHETEVVFFTGAAGDINPITTCGTDFEHLENDAKARTTVYTQYGTFEHTKKIGYYLGEQVVELARSIPSSSYYDRFSFQAYIRTFWVPMQDKQPYVYNRMNWFTNRLLFGFKKWFMFPVAIASAGEEPNFPGLSIKHYPISLRRKWTINAYTMLHYIEMTIFKGTTEKKISIIGIPGELFEDYQRKFLERCPVGAKDTFLFQVANDWVGYLFPIKEYITQPGYEPIASTSPLAGSYIARELYRLWKEIKLEMLCFS